MGKRPGRQRKFSSVHPDAAAIDIGATMHMAAVAPGCDAEPVRSFGTFTGDLHHLAEWFSACGVKDGGHGVHRHLLHPGFRDP
jgi:hypothetical protein